MHASVGDRIVIRGHHLGEPNRDCEVLEVRGPNGEPPYRVRWGDTGHEASVLSRPRRRRSALRALDDLTPNREDSR